MLREYVWEDGRVFPLLEASYRYRILVHCAKEGRQRSEFANGVHPYFCYIEVVAGNDRAISGGVGIVPVLPNGKVVMIVEQRPAHHHPAATNPEIEGVEVNLEKFGPWSSLEFPGGSIEPGQELSGAFLQELTEETGVEKQTALCYRRIPPIYSFGSEIKCELNVMTVFLSGLGHASKVRTDGGLKVFALTPEEVQHNIWKGAIRSGQGALHAWYFYQEVVGLRNNPDLESARLKSGYIKIEEVKIVKT